MVSVTQAGATTSSTQRNLTQPGCVFCLPNPQVVHSIEVLGFELESLRVAAASIATAIQSEHTFVEEDVDPPDTGTRQPQQQDQQLHQHLQQQQQQHHQRQQQAASLRAGTAKQTATGGATATGSGSSAGGGPVAEMSTAFQQLLNNPEEVATPGAAEGFCSLAGLSKNQSLPEQSAAGRMGTKASVSNQTATAGNVDTDTAVPIVGAAAAEAAAGDAGSGGDADRSKHGRGPEVGDLLAAAMKGAGGGNWALRGGGGGSRGDEHDEHRRRQFAATAIRRCALKLEGRDIERGTVVTVGAQVEHLVRQAVSPENLCQMYEGWTPWI